MIDTDLYHRDGSICIERVNIFAYTLISMNLYHRDGSICIERANIFAYYMGLYHRDGSIYRGQVCTAGALHALNHLAWV
jgi:hypothetical protein